MFRQATSPSLLVLLECWIRLCRECVVVRFFRHVLGRLFDDGLRFLGRCEFLLWLLLSIVFTFSFSWGARMRCCDALSLKGMYPRARFPVSK